MVVINPGNPTGQNLSEADIRGVVQFCQEENLVMCADEVYAPLRLAARAVASNSVTLLRRYQANVYKDGDRFTSFKKVVRDLQAPIQLFSFHSTSKVCHCPFAALCFEFRSVIVTVTDLALSLGSHWRMRPSRWVSRNHKHPL